MKELRGRSLSGNANNYVGGRGEVTVDDDNLRLQIHDGTTPGGLVLALDDFANVSDTDFAIKVGGAGVIAPQDEDFVISLSAFVMGSPPGVVSRIFRFGANGDLTVPGIIKSSGVLVLRSSNGSNLMLETTGGGDIYIGYQSPSTNIRIGDPGDGKEVSLYSDRVTILANVPSTSIGVAGDVTGHVAFNTSHMFYCTSNYNGSSNIWKRIAWSADTW